LCFFTNRILFFHKSFCVFVKIVLCFYTEQYQLLSTIQFILLYTLYYFTLYSTIILNSRTHRKIEVIGGMGERGERNLEN